MKANKQKWSEMDQSNGGGRWGNTQGEELGYYDNNKHVHVC